LSKLLLQFPVVNGKTVNMFRDAAFLA